MKLPAYLSEPQNPREWALYWASLGWPVFPLHEVLPNGACSCKQVMNCKQKGKHPRTIDGVKSATSSADKVNEWWSKWPNANIGGAMTGRLALDVDLSKGGSWEAVAELPATRVHLSGRGDGGGHLIFSLTAAQRAQGIKSNNTGRWADGIDIKTGAGNYLVLPGSTHEKGGQYRIKSDGEVTLPQAVLDRLREQDQERVESGEGAKGEGGVVRSLLANLLANPNETERNVWLTKVAGHHAKAYFRQRDVYDAMIAQANASLKSPLGEAEVAKIADSIWKTEHQNHPERDIAAQIKPETGWLASGDYELVCLAWEGPKEDRIQLPAEWADFDLRVKGVIRDPATETITYDLTLLRRRDRAEIDTTIEGRAFGDPKRISGWLASFGVSIAQPEGVVHRTPAPHVKLLRYLQSQEAPETLMAPALGWDWEAGGFLTHEGVITQQGQQPFSLVRPNPALRGGGSAPYRYGFQGTQEEARAVLREVLTYQDQTITSVFGAWWAANLLKPQFMQRVSLFPATAIEAASGAGKTNGFFSMMVQLTGNTRGEGHYTIASLRNALAAHRNGLIWCDDLDDPRKVHELTRSATSNGTITKVAEDRVNLMEYTLVGSMTLTGEALSLSGQKAMVERFVMLRVDSPVGRKSLKPGREGVSQWEDVRDMQERYPERDGGLSVLAGHLVVLALQRADKAMQALREISRTAGSGRVGEKETILRAGARLLDALVSPEAEEAAWRGDGEHARRVEAWLAGGGGGRTFDGDNRMTAEVIPWALRYFGWPTRAEAPSGGRPAFIEIDEGDQTDMGTAVAGSDDGPVVWVSPKRLAECLYEYRSGRVDTRTETAESFQEQLRQLFQGGDEHGDGARRRTAERRQHRTSKEGSGHKQYYWRLTGEAASAVLRRSRGDI